MRNWNFQYDSQKNASSKTRYHSIGGSHDTNKHGQNNNEITSTSTVIATIIIVEVITATGVVAITTKTANDYIPNFEVTAKMP